MAIYKNAWWKLARREYRLNKNFFRGKCPGGCDFRWLTFLLAGVLCMANTLPVFPNLIKLQYLEALLWPYGVILGIFLLLVLWINIGTLIDHRRHRYGILLAKGMPSHQIYLMVFFQMFLVTLVGMVVALFVFLGVKFAILDLLPFDWHYLLVWPVAILITMGIAALHLLLMPLRRDTAPWELLQ